MVTSRRASRIRESLPDAARRETLEEAGCTVADLTLTGVYEMRGAWNQDAYHLIMFAFLADARVTLPAPATADHGVGEIIQGVPAAVRPHPTVMRILNDAGVADFNPAEIDTALAAHDITMLCLHTSSRPRAR